MSYNEEISSFSMRRVRSFAGDVSFSNCFHKETWESKLVALQLISVVVEVVMVCTLSARSRWGKDAVRFKKTSASLVQSWRTRNKQQ